MQPGTGESGALGGAQRLKAVLRPIMGALAAVFVGVAIWDLKRRWQPGVVEVNYGLAALAGNPVAGLEFAEVERILKEAILRFEPRILPSTLSVRGIARVEASSRTADALAAVGLEEHAERPVGELSAGQRERAALARALAARPLAIVADEPTARLDAANALVLGALLADIARTSGTTVICGTHDPLLIEQADAELSLGSS